MTVIFSVAARTSKATADNTSIGSAATISIYGGTRPATPDTAAGSTALVTFTMTGAFGTVTSGVLTASTIPQSTATATGTASWARIATSGGTAIVDMDVSASGGGGDIILGTTSIATGVIVQISSFTLTEN